MQQEIIIDNSVEQYKLTTDEFVYAQADGNYTRIYITHPEADKDGGTVTVTMQMGLLIISTSSSPRQSKATALARNAYICEYADEILMVGVDEKSSLYPLQTKYAKRLVAIHH